jgi:NAD(P)-dependent dehydrogenase (short-subunit alcohol dehydrogenase family)
MGRLTGKTAIITGTAGGLGLTTIELFAKEGANVVAVDVQIDLIKENVAKISDIEGKILPLKMDVSSKADWAEVVEKTVKEFGQVDVLVNNAAVIKHGQSLMETTLEDWNLMIAVNQTGVLLGMQAVVPEMQKVGKGSIINISSIGGIAGGEADSFCAGYSATKGAVRSLTKHAAQMLTKDHIRVNSVHPGAMMTPMLKEALKDETNRQIVERSFPLPPHAADPIDVAYGIVYLASDETKYTTGSELVIDGGFTSR